MPAVDLQNQHKGSPDRGGGFGVMPDHMGPGGKLQQIPLGEVHKQKSGAGVERQIAQRIEKPFPT